MDLMLDLESLATTPDSVILTLGAMKFDVLKGTIYEDQSLYLKPDVDEQIGLGRSINEETVTWWGTQPDDVREEALGESDRICLDDFTRQLNKFLVGVDRIWAQGPVFDIAMLENLYRQVGKPIPWQFWQIRDCRTMLKALGDDRKANRAGAHNAVADCYYQIQALTAAFSRHELTQA